MKIEIEVSDDLVARMGREAIELYLQRKAEALFHSLQNQPADQTPDFSSDTEATDKAWQKFNKRGMSC
jgi:hypothetical protein